RLKSNSSDPDRDTLDLPTYLLLGDKDIGAKPQKQRPDHKPPALSSGHRSRAARGRAPVHRPPLALAPHTPAALHASPPLPAVTGPPVTACGAAYRRDRALIQPPPYDDTERGRFATRQMAMLRPIATDTGSTRLIVTHDARIMNQADRIVHMERGRIESNVV